MESERNLVNILSSWSYEEIMEYIREVQEHLLETRVPRSEWINHEVYADAMAALANIERKKNEN